MRKIMLRFSIVSIILLNGVILMHMDHWAENQNYGRTIFAMDMPMPTPNPGRIGNENLVTSGDYQYQVLDDVNKTISIRKISNYGSKVIIPDSIDGYRVTAIGYIGDLDFIDNLLDTHVFQTEEDFIVKTLIIPEGVTIIGSYAMCSLKALENLELPVSLTSIKEAAFVGCSNLKELEIPKNTFLAYSCFSSCGGLEKVTLHTFNLDEDVFTEPIGTLIITKDASPYVSLGSALVGCTIKNLCVEKGVKTLDLSNSSLENTINRLYIQDSNTKVVHKDNIRLGSLQVGKVITVLKAKAISYAKKKKITYVTLKTPSVTKINKTKIKGGYKFTWNKVKETATTNRYNNAKKKWISTTKKKNVSYHVFVSGRKKGKYAYQKTISKSVFTWKGNGYVKIKPVSFSL